MGPGPQAPPPQPKPPGALTKEPPTAGAKVATQTGPMSHHARWKYVTWCVLFDACVQVLNSTTNIPTSALSAFKVVNKMTKVKGW